MIPSPVSRRLAQVGYLLVGGALLCASAALVHMRDLVQTYGVICGSGSGALAHCPACLASVAFLAAGAASLILSRTAARTTTVARAQHTRST